MKNADVEQEESKISRKEKIKAMFIAASNSGGQTVYFNYANLVAVGIGATPIQMSFITSIQNLGSALLQGFFGKLSDRFGRKIILLLGFIIATITTAVLAFNSSTITFMIIIAIYSLGISMIIPSWNALIGDISTEKSRVKILGQLGMVGTISASLFLLILGFLTDYLPFPENFWIFSRDLANYSYRFTILTEFLPFPDKFLIFSSGLIDYKYRFMIFCGAFLLAFASIFVITLTETNVFKRNNKERMFKRILQNKSFSVLTTVTLVWWFVMSFLWPLSPYILKRLEPSAAQVAILSAVFSASMALAQISARRIVNKIGRKMTIVLGLAFLCLVPLVLAFSTQWYIIIFANIFGGFGNATLMVSVSAEILDMADPENKGAYSGAYNLLMGITTFCGSFLCGILFEYFTKGMEYMNNSFYTILRIALISITVIRLVATTPIIIYAIKNRKK